jgi:FkbM family methyltransferase
MRKLSTMLLKLLEFHSDAKVIRNQITPSRSRENALDLQRKMLEFYSQLLSKGDLCFDVEASLGDFFLELGAIVICIEQQETCLRRLHKIFGNNPKVIIVDKVVGGEEGYGELAINEKESTISIMSDKWRKEGRFSKEHKWIRTQDMYIITLDSLTQSYGLQKSCEIDVEGFEESGLKRLAKPVFFVPFEFTGEFFGDAKKCINHLLSIGHVESNCSLNESARFLFSEWATPEELHKKIDLMEDKLLWSDIYARFTDPNK